LLVSNVLYFNRTKAKPGRRFWLAREVLTPREYALNRAGFSLAIAALVLMVVGILAGSAN
jgi:hypothetical protein